MFFQNSEEALDRNKRLTASQIYLQQTGRAAGNRKWKTRINASPQNGNYPLTNRQGHKLGKTKRSISEIQVIFFPPSLHSYFDSPKMNRFDTLYVALTQTSQTLWLLLHSPFPPVSRVSHHQNQSSIGLGLRALRRTNVFWHKPIFGGIMFFSFTFIC